MNQFYTLLHTTLKLGDDKNESPPTTPTNPDEVEPGRQLSPVPELSESHLSTEKEVPLRDWHTLVRGYSKQCMCPQITKETSGGAYIVKEVNREKYNIQCKPHLHRFFFSL